MDLEEKYSIGDYGYLKKPYQGYKYVEIIGFEGNKLVVRLSSGFEITIYADELEDN